MCTLSWFFDKENTHVFFNRDEQKSRAIAEPPRVVCTNQVDRLMPIDPVGGGSWLAVNEFGWAFALLNFYQGRTPKGKLISRGHIIRGVSELNCFGRIVEFFDGLKLAKYAPFSLVCFAPNGISVDDMPPHQCVNGQTATMLRWTGNALQIVAQRSPLFSSAVMFDDVVFSRTKQAEEYIGGVVCERERIDKHIALHCSHEPAASAQSICMHREDAHTVSFSHIEVTHNNVMFNYTNGSPCTVSIPTKHALFRKNCIHSL